MAHAPINPNEATVMSDAFPFTKPYVDAAAELAGVYWLFYGQELIYFGRATGGTVTIRSRLQSHLRGDEGPCTRGASHFGYEVCNNPIARERELLEDYQRRYGRLPRCNSRIG